MSIQNKLHAEEVSQTEVGIEDPTTASVIVAGAPTVVEIATIPGVPSRWAKTFPHDQTYRMTSHSYAVAKSRTDLYFGVDADISEVTDANGDKMKRGKRSSTANKALEDYVSLGYGEITLGSMERIFHFFDNAPEEFRVTDASTFLDLGSGFGKCVFHAALRLPFQHCVGIEYLDLRNRLGNEVFRVFFSSPIPHSFCRSSNSFLNAR